jgi:pyruvate/2-oxoglutarate dehydrogenase complex dihydrolipoamide dehydrogenase (E3) component
LLYLFDFCVGHPDKKSAGPIPFVVRYLTTNGTSDTYGRFHPFALRYRRVNGTFYELISFMRQGVKSQLNKKKVEILQGKGKIIRKGKLEVNGKTYAYKNLILASGAKWMKPGFPGSDTEGVNTTDELLAREKLPKKILLYGNSPWLISTAQFLHRYGIEMESGVLAFLARGYECKS